MKSFEYAVQKHGKVKYLKKKVSIFSDPLECKKLNCIVVNLTVHGLHNELVGSHFRLLLVR